MLYFVFDVPCPMFMHVYSFIYGVPSLKHCDLNSRKEFLPPPLYCIHYCIIMLGPSAAIRLGQDRGQRLQGLKFVKI